MSALRLSALCRAKLKIMSALSVSKVPPISLSLAAMVAPLPYFS
ncbi:MAG: hypothetical protein A4E73_01083 [Syntrophaceae bacterium PtaU1.Bin231]|nr:MAG: hypothetical protein A4E73_01083 [Syntrophaceae bacterium PtaU1.Bin231]